jgi:hypothetical protein
MYWRLDQRFIRRARGDFDPSGGAARRLQSPAPEQGCGAFHFHASAPFNGAQQEFVMAQERKRSNREVKKPKAIKPAKDPNPPLMAAGRLAPIKQPKKG